MHFKFYFLSSMGSYFVTGVLVTLGLSIATIIAGTALGLVFAVLRMSRAKVLQVISTMYTTFVRGVPTLVFIYIVYYGIDWNATPFVAGIVALSICSSAYIAEIIRSGINAVPSGQMEAARTLGMSNLKAMRYVIIPQAVKNILPALGSQLITTVKDTSLVSVLGLAELTYNTDSIRNATYLAFEPLIICAIIYFILTWTLKKGIDRMESVLNKVERK